MQEYETFGKGSPFLIFPGTLEGIKAHEDFIDRFSKDYTLCVFDHYRVKRVTDFCDFVSTVLEKEKLTGPIIVYGHSLGAMLAQSFTKRNPYKVLNLILSHGCLPDSPSFTRSVVPMYKIVQPVLSKVTDEQIKNWKQKLLDLSGNALSGAQKSLSHMVSQELLGKIEKLIDAHLGEEKLDKEVLECAVSLALDFVKNEKFKASDFTTWSGKALILRTDNDYFMNKDGGIKDLYPDVREVVFTKTSHLTRHLRFAEMAREIEGFLRP